MQKIVLYIASKAMKQIIEHTIKELDLATLDCNNQIGNAISLDDFMSKKGFLLSDNDVNYFVIDISALVDSDEKIISAIGGFLTMHESVRIIIIAPKHRAGDDILSQLFGLGIRNFAVGRDFVILKEGLERCLSEQGMSYREAIEYKDVIEHAQRDTEEFREVNKVLIGMIGTLPRVGCTHNAIIIANQLKRMGYAVAVVEMNPSGTFQLIRNNERVGMIDNLFFTSRKIDYYPSADDKKLKKILEDKVYNFLVLDFGNFKDCDINCFNRCHVKIAIGNVQSWEISYLAELWNRYDEEARKQIHFYINFLSDKQDRKVLEKAFKTKFHYLPFMPDPFEKGEYPDLKEILADYLPSKPKEKSGLFRFGKKVVFS